MELGRFSQEELVEERTVEEASRPDGVYGGVGVLYWILYLVKRSERQVRRSGEI